MAFIESGQDRKSTFSRRFFPIPPSVFIRRSLRKQCQTTLNVLVAEADKLPESSLLKPMADVLRTAANSGLEALDARNEGEAQRTLAGNDVTEWKEGINALRLSTYGELFKLASAKGYGRRWADTFFRINRDTGGEEEPEPEIEPPEPEQPPAEPEE